MTLSKDGRVFVVVHVWSVVIVGRDSWDPDLEKVCGDYCFVENLTVDYVSFF